MQNYQHYIDDCWMDPSSGAWSDTTNPCTGEDWAKIAHGNATDVDSAVVAVRNDFESRWIRSSYHAAKVSEDLGLH